MSNTQEHGTQRGFTLHTIKAEVPCGPCKEASIDTAAKFFGMTPEEMRKQMAARRAE